MAVHRRGIVSTKKPTKERGQVMSDGQQSRPKKSYVSYSFGISPRRFYDLSKGGLVFSEKEKPTRQKRAEQRGLPETYDVNLSAKRSTNNGRVRIDEDSATIGENWQDKSQKGTRTKKGTLHNYGGKYETENTAKVNSKKSISKLSAQLERIEELRSQGYGRGHESRIINAINGGYAAHNYKVAATGLSEG